MPSVPALFWESERLWERRSEGIITNYRNCGDVLFLKGRVRWGAPEGVDPAPGTSQGLGASPGAAGVDAETLSPVAAARSHGLGRGGAPEVSFRVGKWGRRWSVRVEAGRGGVLGRATREASARGGEAQSSRGESLTGHARFLTDTTVRVTRATESG